MTESDDAPRRWSRRSAWVIAAALAASSAGCAGDQPAASGTFYPVKGKVTLPDGKPLAGVSIHFTGPYGAIARTESDGTFAFKGEKEGLPEGDYRIWLEGTGSKSTGRRAAALPFPSRYSDEDASKLTAKVTPSGPNDFDFKLTNEEAGAASSPRGSGPAKVTD